MVNRILLKFVMFNRRVLEIIMAIRGFLRAMKGCCKVREEILMFQRSTEGSGRVFEILMVNRFRDFWSLKL